MSFILERPDRCGPPNPIATFHGPLFQVVLRDGSEEAVEPIPRELLHFLQNFTISFEVWRLPSPIFWANNRSRVVRIAQRYVANVIEHWYYHLHSLRDELRRVILQCNECTNDGPCILCEFAAQNLAIAFQAENFQATAAQSLLHYLPSSLIFHVISFASGSESRIRYLSQLALRNILFIQDILWAPEIRQGVIDRQTFAIWASAVEENRLVAYDQYPFSEADYPDIYTYSLRAFPGRRDPDWVTNRPNIRIRSPSFLTTADLSLEVERQLFTLVIGNNYLFEREQEFSEQDGDSDSDSAVSTLV